MRISSIFYVKTFFLLIRSISMIKESIYIYDTENTASVQVYDCFIISLVLFCRRPLHPQPLERNRNPPYCNNQGIPFSFDTLAKNNITVHEVLHTFKSTLDKAEDYAHYHEYPRSSIDTSQYLCNCTNTRSFGRHCEYLLPESGTFEKIISTKFINRTLTKKLMNIGDIVCYTTLKCDYGRLCLDWRDICDGKQQCMFGYDEENCDKLEFNECEDDEYRCRNGMCIPEDYFLDTTADCMDKSDEIDMFDDGAICPSSRATVDCDDRLCAPHHWSCGDGQCISERIPFLAMKKKSTGCLNRRDQFFWCEEVVNETLITLPNGRCTNQNLTDEDHRRVYCTHLLMCHFMKSETSDECLTHFKEVCSNRSLFDFARSGIIAPYVNYRFQWTSDEQLDWLMIFNGSIKCRGRIAHLFEKIGDFNLFDLLTRENSIITEIIMCASGNTRNDTSVKGYDKSCYNNSRTFNNRSYATIDVCEKTFQCLSAYRIADGIVDCQDGADENQSNEIITESCKTVHRHRFQCTSKQVTCLYAAFVGNSKSECIEDTDEYWNDMRLSMGTLNCKLYQSEDCNLFRLYIAASSNTTLHNITLMKDLSERSIAFRYYCDTFMDLYLNKDEEIEQCQQNWKCPSDEWQCYSGHCIDKRWVLDDEWDCPDASDEENMFAYSYNSTLQNYQWLQSSIYTKKFLERYENESFWSVCHIVHPPSSSPQKFIDEFISNRSCIEFYEDITSPLCLDVHSQDIVLRTCIRLLALLGFQFRYFSIRRCLTPSSLLLSDYENKTRFFPEISCEYCEQTGHERESIINCWSTKKQYANTCNGQVQCPDGEDEYMCPTNKSTAIINREKKRSDRRTAEKHSQVARYPSIKSNQSIQHSSLVRKTRNIETIDNRSDIHQWCNRGIGMLSINNTIICFCPPQYHGDQCQYHSDRLIFHYHINFTHLDENRANNYDLIIKFLILFSINDQVMSSDESHFRVKTEIDENRRNKKTNYFHYSRLPEYLHHKQKRFFDRMNITNHHPYSIRVEAFDMYLNVKPIRFAVWHFPIYFDFLPVFRFSKILRFYNRKEFNIDPCSTKPCSINAECFVIENQPTKHICLCREGYYGQRCENRHELCDRNYCSSKSLCQANYRGLIYGKEWPYCICSLNQIGQRCFLYPNACIDNPCQNGGTCYQRSQPHRSQCQCTEEYHGDLCENRKPSIMIDILPPEKQMIDFEAVMLQYFVIDTKSFNLKLKSENLFRSMPSKWEHFYDSREGPDIILAKFYSLIKEKLHLITYQLKDYSNLTTSISTENHCPHINTFISTTLSIFQYHSLCQQNQNMSCFYDEKYLCFCETNHQRAECFNYESKSRECQKCLARGRCIESRTDKMSLCICPSCHTGYRCQFNFESFAFTLDQLFYSDLLSDKRGLRSFTFYSLLIIPWFLFFLGLVNNLFSFVTFRQKQSLQNGIGQYLYYMSIFNQMNLTFLLIRLTHLTINIASPYTYPQFDNLFCKLSNYFLLSSTRMIYWLSSLIAIERLYVVLFLQGQWLKKPQTARRFLFIMILVILLCSSYEIYLVRSEITSEDGFHAICTMNFPTHTSAWMILHTIVTIIDSLVPFSINLISTIVIICTVTKKKFNANTHRQTLADTTITTNSFDLIQKITLTAPIQIQTIHVNMEQKLNRLLTSNDKKQTRFQLLKDVLMENKELVFAPSMTLIPQLFSLPFFIASFTLTCQNLHQNRLRYLLMVSFFTQFIPQLISFYLYITPSSFYQRQWHKTRLAQWIRDHHPSASFFSRPTQLNERMTS